ncbi:MAG: hypothetical protein ABW215_22575 [Kibdelosporangium sp.]
MATVIAACEVGFWVLLLLGLSARYLLRLRRTSTVLLVSVPLVDVVLLVATVIDLNGGAKATQVHGLATIFLGFSVAFGHSMMRWADQRFAYKFAGGPPPWKPPKSGPERVRYEWREWGKFVLAWAIACGVMLLLIHVVSTPEHTTALWQSSIPGISMVGLIWLIWPVSETFSRKNAKT